MAQKKRRTTTKRRRSPRRKQRKGFLRKILSGVRRGVGGMLGLGKKRRRARRKPRTAGALTARNPWLGLMNPRRPLRRRRSNPRRHRRSRNPVLYRRRRNIDLARGGAWVKEWGQRAIGFGLGWVAVQFLHEKALSRLLPMQWRNHWAGVLLSKGVAAGISTWLFNQVSKATDISQAFLWGAVGNVALDAIGTAVSAAGVKVPGLPVFAPTGAPAAVPAAEEAKVKLPPSTAPGAPVQALPAPASQVAAMLNATQHHSAKNTVYKPLYVGY